MKTSDIRNAEREALLALLPPEARLLIEEGEKVKAEKEKAEKEKADKLEAEKLRKEVAKYLSDKSRTLTEIKALHNRMVNEIAYQDGLKNRPGHGGGRKAKVSTPEAKVETSTTPEETSLETVEV
jgi:hypothetical protein